MKIGVIDYGASNIFSVVRALNSLGASTKILKKSKSSTEGSQRGSKCGTRNPMGNSFCRKCGNNLKRGNLEYFIEYRDQGKRKYQ